jgi:mRNA interferase RelE/StbE
VRKILWSEPARLDVRRLDRDTAMRIFSALHRFAETGEGDIKKLKGEEDELRLRVGDYRVRFTEELDGTLQVHSVRHRSEAYR